MSEEMENQTEESQIEESQVEESQVEDDTQDAESTEVESRETFLDKLKNLGKKMVKGEEVHEVEETEEDELEGQDIPDNFTNAALEAGWSEEDIADFASDYTDEELTELIGSLFLDDESDEEGEDTGEEGEEEEEESTSDTDGSDEIDEKIQAILAKQKEELTASFRKEIDSLKEGLSEVEKEKQVKEIQNIGRTTDEFFDKLASEYPVFGKTEELAVFPKGTPQEGQIVPIGEAYQARNEVFQTAWKFHQMGSGWSDALNDAWYLYRGKNMEKELQTKLVKDLKRSEKRLSPKRTSKNTTKSFANETDEKVSVVQEAARKSGMSV